MLLIRCLLPIFVLCCCCGAVSGVPAYHKVRQDFKIDPRQKWLCSEWDETFWQRLSCSNWDVAEESYRVSDRSLHRKYRSELTHVHESMFLSGEHRLPAGRERLFRTPTVRTEFIVSRRADATVREVARPSVLAQCESDTPTCQQFLIGGEGGDSDATPVPRYLDSQKC